ncbi:MAG: undecaprenyl-diphosphate phosphatase [Candidatus Peregrinibacteria bacterium]
MTTLSALLLGLLQGFTELFPISSSGHLAIAQSLFGLGIPANLLAFDVVLHAGSLAALVVCYFRIWWSIALSPFRKDAQNIRLLILLIIATIPGAVVGFFFQDFIEHVASSRMFIAVSFAITGVILLLAERLPQRRERSSIGTLDAVAIGIAQACALVPGLSRSGLTIAAGRASHLTRRAAVDFSFLMAVPIIAGAVLLTFRHVLNGTAQLPPLPITLTGFCASFVASLLAILFILRFVRSHSLAWFALWLFPLSLVLLLMK